MPLSGRAELAHPEVAGWMLGSLEAAEADRFRTHLAGCPDCQAAVAELAPVGQALRHVPPAVEPPPGLEARTIASVLDAAAAERRAGQATGMPLHAGEAAGTPLRAGQATGMPLRGGEDAGTRLGPGEATTLRPGQSTTHGRRPGRAGRARRTSWWPHWNPRVLAAAGAAAAAVIVAVAVTLSQGATPAPRPAALIALHSPSGGPAAGRAVVSHRPGGWSIRLTVHGLKELGAGQFYECWYAGPGNRPGNPQLITAGTFTTGRGGTGTFTMWSAADPRLFSTMQITAQRPGDGSQRGQIILTGQARL